MKNLLLFILFALSFTQCTQEEPITPTPVLETELDCADSPNACAIIQSNNSFGFKVFQQLHEGEPDKNLFISPTSIATALTMTLNGAEGNTKTEMQSTLELNDFTLAEVNGAYQTLLPAIQSLDNEVTLNIANSIWNHEAYPAYDEFLDTNEKFFFSEVQMLNFFADDAKDRMNDWVSDKTNGLIESIIEQISPDDIMFLINAIYFKGNWNVPFDPEETIPMDFYVDATTTETIDMMRIERQLFPFLYTEKFQMVDLAYGDSIYSMSVLIPEEDYQVDDIVQDLNMDNWNDWVAQLSNQELNLALPKFDLEYDKELKDILSELGMKDLFEQGAADLSNLASGNIFVSSVKHKSFIAVDEVGTEAAAATSVTVTNESAAPLLMANRPFVFVIRENAGNSVLFAGKMMNPNE